MTQGIFHVTLRGEDGSIFTREFSGSQEHILEEARELWPEAKVLDWFDPVEREEEIYRRVCRRMDDEDVYHDD
jgi:hypothetical protein